MIYTGECVYGPINGMKLVSQRTNVEAECLLIPKKDPSFEKDWVGTYSWNERLRAWLWMGK